MPKEDKDVSFKPVPEQDVDAKVDERLEKVRDRMKLLDDIKNKPPKPGVMTTIIPPGSYAVDLNTLLAAQISDCPATVIPMLIDHGVRTAVDIKDTYRTEKRHLDFQYWWVIFLVIGLLAVMWLANMMFGIF